MKLMSLKNILLRPAQFKAIERRATLAGTTTPEYVRKLIERDLLAQQNFDEILRPIREDVRKSGVTEEQVDAIVRRARKQGAPVRRRSRA